MSATRLSRLEPTRPRQTLVGREPGSAAREPGGQALRDPRREVRSKVIDAILRFRLENLTPALVEAYERDRSRKGKREIKDALRHFNQRRDVIEFGRENAFTDAFFRPPLYVHDWEEAREDGWF
jgi:hypothetical protein